MTLTFPLLPQVTLPFWERGLEGTGAHTPAVLCIFGVGGGRRVRKEADGEGSRNRYQVRWPLHLAALGSYQSSSCWRPQLGLAHRLAELRGAWNMGRKGTCHIT